jgi:hypothetical protein
MHEPFSKHMKLFFNLLLFFTTILVHAQPVTAVWRGKMSDGKGMLAKSLKVEVKLVKRGDSLVGTAYYYMNTNNYIRYSVKGYLDNSDKSVHWWDDKLLGVKPPGTKTVILFDQSMHSDATFNCPNPNVMKLDGNSHIGDDGPEFTLHFDKTDKPLFPDEWDNVIEGYFTGMSDPGIIDSVVAITKVYQPVEPGAVVAKAEVPGDNKKDNKLASDQSVVAGTDPQASVKAEPPPGKPAALPSATGAKTEIPTGKQTAAVVNDKKEQPPVEKSKAVGDTPAAGIVLVPKTSPAEDKPLASGAPAMKPQDSSTIAQQKTITDTNQVAAPVVAKTLPGTNKPGVDSASLAKTNQPIAKPVTDASGTVAKKTDPQQDVAKQVTTPVGTSVVTTASSTLPGDEIAKSTTRPNASKVPVVTIKPVTTPERMDPVAVQKFVTRKRVDQGEIAIVGDSIELNFYDNAEIDGDSISLFLNGKLLFNHVLLSAQAYTFKLAVKDLPEGSELTMVAENLGSIPPNTAYMTALVNGQRYSARLESTEQSSGVIKLVRKSP